MQTPIHSFIHSSSCERAPFTRTRSTFRRSRPCNGAQTSREASATQSEQTISRKQRCSHTTCPLLPTAKSCTDLQNQPPIFWRNTTSCRSHGNFLQGEECSSVLVVVDLLVEDKVGPPKG